MPLHDYVRKRSKKLNVLKRTCRIQIVWFPNTPQMPALSKISDSVMERERGPTVDPDVLEYTVYLAFHAGTSSSGGVARMQS